MQVFVLRAAVVYSWRIFVRSCKR